MRLRLLILALALLPAIAVAQTDPDVSYVGKIQNKSGGYIMLMTSNDRAQCQASGTRDVLAYNPKGETLEGCWQYMSDLQMVKVTWAVGEVRLYPGTDVALHPKLQQQMEREQAEKAAHTNL